MAGSLTRLVPRLLYGASPPATWPDSLSPFAPAVHQQPDGDYCPDDPSAERVGPYQIPAPPEGSDASVQQVTEPGEGRCEQGVTQRRNEPQEQPAHSPAQATEQVIYVRGRRTVAVLRRRGGRGELGGLVGEDEGTKW